MEPGFLIFGWLLIGLGTLIALGNWWIFARSLITGQFESCVPIVGGIALSLGLLVLPGSRPYSWTGLLADPGTLLLIIAIPRLAKEAYETSEMRLVSVYCGRRDSLEVELRLFRKNIWLLKRSLRDHHKVWQPGMTHLQTSMSQTGKFQIEEASLILEPKTLRMVFERVERDGLEGWRNTSEDPDTPLSIHGIDLIRMA